MGWRVFFVISNIWRLFYLLMPKQDPETQHEPKRDRLMPGISAYYTKNSEKKTKGLLHVLKEVLHHNDYTAQIFLDDKNVSVGCTCYPKYPVLSFKRENVSVFFEGKIYNSSPEKLKKDLLSFAEQLQSDNGGFMNGLKTWVGEQDGEFVGVLYNKAAHELAVFNDQRGLLPLYYSLQQEGLILSREIKVVTQLMENVGLDQMTSAQFLLFGYPLGGKTLLKGISKFSPASVLRLNTINGDNKLTKLHISNFDIRKHENNTIRTNAENLRELFLDACKRRAVANEKNIVSLSGGLDSRAIAVALTKLKVPFTGATFLAESKGAKRDVQIAEQLADAFNIPWELFSLPPMRGADIRKLLSLKSGSNTFEMSFILQFFKALREKYSSGLVYFTGEGGLWLKPDHMPFVMRNNCLDEAVQIVVKKYQCIPLQQVTALTGVEVDDIRQGIRELLEAYPEQKVKNKLLHFKLYERACNSMFEAEDRNRCFFWDSVPFYGLNFFQYATGCPDKQKKYYNLYISFIKALEEKAAEIENVDWGLPVGSKKVPVYLRARDIYLRLPNTVKTALRKVRNGKDKKEKKFLCSPLQDVLMQTAQCGPAEKILLTDHIEKMSNNFNMKQCYQVLTLLSVIEQFTQDRKNCDVLSRYETQIFRGVGIDPAVRSFLHKI